MLCRSCLPATGSCQSLSSRHVFSRRASSSTYAPPRLAPSRLLLPQAAASRAYCAEPARRHQGPSWLSSLRLAAWSPRPGRTYSTSASTSPQNTTTDSPVAVPAVEKPPFLNEAESVIWDMLVTEFEPSELVVQDISGGCGSMYGIEISSERFRGANMLKQQRMVNAVLGDLMKSWHGVQLKTRVP